MQVPSGALQGWTYPVSVMSSNGVVAAGQNCTVCSVWTEPISTATRRFHALPQVPPLLWRSAYVCVRGGLRQANWSLGRWSRRRACTPKSLLLTWLPRQSDPKLDSELGYCSYQRPPETARQLGALDEPWRRAANQALDQSWRSRRSAANHAALPIKL